MSPIPQSAARAPLYEYPPRSSPAIPLHRGGCGNPLCNSSWLSFLKDRRRPNFEGRWGCSAACIAAMVGAAIRREAREAGEPERQDPEWHRIPLGLLLLARGVVTQRQLQHALYAQQRAGSGLIGEWLMDQCGTAQEHITRALAVQCGCPVLSAEDFRPELMARTVPKVLLEATGGLPLRIAANRFLYLGFSGRLDASAAFAIQRMSGLKVQTGLLDPHQWTSMHRRLRECSFIDTKFQPIPSLTVLARNVASEIVAAQSIASRLVRMHHFYWLRMWLETGAMSTRDGGFPASTEDVLDRVYTIGSEQ